MGHLFAVFIMLTLMTGGVSSDLMCAEAIRYLDWVVHLALLPDIFA